MYILGYQLKISNLTLFPSYDISVFHAYFPTLLVTAITLMSTSEHGDEAEIAASVLHSSGQLPLEPAIQDTVPTSLSAVPDTLDKTTREREKLSTSQIPGAFFGLLYFYSALDVALREFFFSHSNS